MTASFFDPILIKFFFFFFFGLCETNLVLKLLQHDLPGPTWPRCQSARHRHGPRERPRMSQRPAICNLYPANATGGHWMRWDANVSFVCRCPRIHNVGARRRNRAHSHFRVYYKIGLSVRRRHVQQSLGTVNVVGRRRSRFS